MGRGRKGEEPRGLKPLHRLFAFEVLGGASAAEAYRAIYPKASPATAETNGPRLLRTAQVAAFVEERRAKVLEKAELGCEVKLERILLELHRILDIDPLAIWDDQLTLKRLEDIPQDLRRAIASMKVTEMFDGQGDERELVGYLREVKFHPKTEASNQLLRVLGAYKDKLEVEVVGHADLVAEAVKRARAASAGSAR
jgi:phage terminase small subunit